MVPGRRRQPAAGEPGVVLVQVEGRELRQVLAPERLSHLPDDAAGLQERLRGPATGLLVPEVLLEQLAKRMAGRVFAGVDLHRELGSQAVRHPPAAVDRARHLATLPGQGIERRPDSHLPNARPPFAYPGHAVMIAGLCGMSLWD